MDEYYVRVYTMRDGSEAEPNAVYAKYEQAVAELHCFNPSGEGVDDFQNVSYVQIEKRFSPRPFWDEQPLVLSEA